jgi:hypothetical protein
VGVRPARRAGAPLAGTEVKPMSGRPFARKVGLLALALAVLPAAAQQFDDQTATRFPVPNPTEYTNQAALGDLEGDGDLDILFANGGGFSSPGTPQKVRVYMNNGSGVFTDESDARTGGLTGLHRGVGLGDCDGDGDLDMVLAQDFDLLPNLLINNGSGFFTVEGSTRLPNITLSSSRGLFGDVDNDGDLDLFFTSGDEQSKFGPGQYRVYLNDGSCFYSDATATHFPLVEVEENQDAIFGDIDNDFDLDIRTASTGTNNSRLYRNNGAGVYAVVNGVPADSTTYSYDFGDIDGDGDLDLLGINGSTGSSEILLQNDGTGAYTDVSGQVVPNPSQDDNDSKFFDYDNDGDLDLIIGRIGGPEKVYNNNGLGTFTQVSGVIDAITDSTLDLQVADLTGDGAYDVVTAQGESGNFQNRIYVNTGSADVLPPVVVQTEEVPAPPGPGPWVVRALVLDHVTGDRGFYATGMQLQFQVDRGSVQGVEMLHSGGQVYRGVLPSQPAGSLVEYWVRATDSNGNTGTGSIESFVVPDCSGVANCSGHGVCIGVDQCLCDAGWQGVDCSQELALGAGSVPDGSTPPALPLRLRKAPANGLFLGWAASCGVNDEDYEIYEGTIGDFTSHTPLHCSTAGAKSKIVTPGAGDTYYLVVPRSVNREGSYGKESDGDERPSSGRACLPQSIVSCP